VEGLGKQTVILHEARRDVDCDVSRTPGWVVSGCESSGGPCRAKVLWFGKTHSLHGRVWRKRAQVLTGWAKSGGMDPTGPDGARRRRGIIGSVGIVDDDANSVRPPHADPPKRVIHP